MDNESIAAAVVNVQQARLLSQNAIVVLKESLESERSMNDSMAGNVERVGDVQDAAQAVTQSSRVLNAYA